MASFTRGVVSISSRSVRNSWRRTDHMLDVPSHAIIYVCIELPLLCHDAFTVWDCRNLWKSKETIRLKAVCAQQFLQNSTCRSDYKTLSHYTLARFSLIDTTVHYSFMRDRHLCRNVAKILKHCSPISSPVPVTHPWLLHESCSEQLFPPSDFPCCVLLYYIKVPELLVLVQLLLTRNTLSSARKVPAEVLVLN